jgi:membrane-bound lytic murein transglycosylase B
MLRLAKICLTFVLFSPFFSAYADKTFVQRKDVQQFINFMVKEQGFNRQQLSAIMDQVKIQPLIIESMNKPYEKKNWDVYKALFLTPQRLQAGLEFWQKNQQALARAEKKFGVPASIIVAIIGVETLYGKHQGNYRVLDALSTLAFNYPQRAPFFVKELKEFLLLCNEHGVSPTEYLGSYAGAIGKPQFMPSSYRFYAVDFTGNGKKDLINDDSDAIGSVANYFHKHGWKTFETVAQPAIISGNNHKQIQTNAKFANYPVKKLAAFGIKSNTLIPNQPKRAGLIELITQFGKEFWMGYPNFFVITRYNSSPQYALVVYLFSQQLQNQRAKITTTKDISNGRNV